MISPVLLIAFFLKALEVAAGYIWGTAGVEWTEARQKQKVSYMVSKYGSNWKTDPEAKKDNYYSAAANGAKWIGHIVYDCSGLFYAAFKSLGGYIFHGSNTIWLKYCTSKGELKNGKRDDDNVFGLYTLEKTSYSFQLFNKQFRQPPRIFRYKRRSNGLFR